MVGFFSESAFGAGVGDLEREALAGLRLRPTRRSGGPPRRTSMVRLPKEHKFLPVQSEEAMEAEGGLEFARQYFFQTVYPKRQVE